VNPFKLVQKYGIKSFFYGTLLKSPRIAGDHPHLIKAVEDKGNEIICHGYNHAGWADNYEKYTPEEMRHELHKSFEAFKEVSGRYPHAAGVPNWRTNYKAVQICEDFGGFEYLADVRGDCPFTLVDENKTYNCIQIPITLPTTHELLQADRKRADIVPELIDQLNDGYNVFCIHDWFEGLYNMDFVEDFVRIAKEKGYEFITMQEATKRLKASETELPKNKIGNKALEEGGVKMITHQLWS
jgi:peptidoglycan/xylan/chitin deacetylase (PgdA/CDA1 family)